MSNAAKQVEKGERHDWLDWLRAVSILLVLATHYQVDWSDAGLFMPIAMASMRFGWAGVDFFFVISGFLIGNLLLGEIVRHGRLEAGRFYFRRLLKIWPLYYLTCLAYVALSPSLLGQTYFEGLRMVMSSLFHLQNYVGPVGMGHLWSLAVEEHFYLLLPILIAVCHRLSRPEAFARNLVGLIVTGICLVVVNRAGAALAYDLTSVDVRGPTHYRVDALFCGVLLACMYRFYPVAWLALQGNGRVLLIVAITGATTFAFNPNQSKFVATLGLTLVSLTFGSILVFTSRFDAAAKPSTLERPLALLAWVGRHSYPIYLFHPFLWLFMDSQLGWSRLVAGTDLWTRSALWLLGFVAFIGASIGLGAIIGSTLEKPLLRFRNRILPPRVAVLEPASSTQDETKMDEEVCDARLLSRSA